MNEPNEIERIVGAALALGLDSPIIHYRIVGERIELWTVHGGPYIYPPGRDEASALPASPPPAPEKKKAIRAKK